MKHFLLFIISCLLSVPLFGLSVASVNLDIKTSSAMASAYLLQSGSEGLNDESVQKILDHYSSAEVATAGIFASKWLDRKAMENAGLFNNAEENYYYRRIYSLVSAKIMPKLLTVGTLMIKHPEEAIYWGPYLFKTCEQTKELCMIFESVVANGRVSFQDIVFLAINDNLRGLFDLARLGDVDWKALWEHFSEFGDGLTKEALQEDLDNLMNAGTAIASAGGALLDSMWVQGSKVGKVFQMTPGEVFNMYLQFRDMYETFKDPMNIKNLVMSQIMSTDSTGVANLFSISNYNITSYLSDFYNEMQGRYYRQRWYIYRDGGAPEVVCNYRPPNDRQAIFYDPDWYRVATTNQYYEPTAEEYELSLRNSEYYAGFSREKCRAIVDMAGRQIYHFENTLVRQRVYDLDTRETVGVAFAHNIVVTKIQNAFEEVYEEYFDSQYDTEAAIQARFNAKLMEYNSNENGFIYKIGKGEKMPYSSADESKMKGCSTASYMMECDDSANLGEGNFSWKENGDQRNALDENSKRYAMQTTLSSGPNTDEIDAMIQPLASEVTSLTQQIQNLENENSRLLGLISKSSIEDAARYREQYNANINTINTLRSHLESAKADLKQLEDGKAEILEDYADEKDGIYRIPALMHELETAYNLQWADAGSWSGYTFVRHANVPNINGSVTFQAELRRERKESRFLGIRFHRAILAVHWQLKADYSTSEIVDIIELDNSLSDAEKAEKVNARHRELLSEHPGCRIEINYAYSNQQEVPDDQESVHLLWVSDRLKVARDVDYRLSKIYSQLVLLEKFLRTRETLLDRLKQMVGIYVLDGTQRTRIGSKSFRRWRRSASAAAVGESVDEVLADMQSDDEEI